MKGRILLAIAAVLFFQSIEAVFGDWSAGDDYKMHSPQEPNCYGWDICLNHQGLADDFVCSETGKITDIHFWVSWQGDDVSFETTEWTIQIFDDAGGRPGASLWTWNRSDGDVVYRPYGEGKQGWYCPSTGLQTPDDHVNYYQVNITGIKGAFEQTKDTRYWLFISADTLDEKTNVGWKSSTSEYYSSAVWLNSDKAWVVIGDAAYDLAFVITGEAASFVEQDEFDYSVGELELLTPSGPVTIYLRGPSAMDVYFEGWTEGTADDDDVNGLEEVQTEMVELDLVGMSPAVGLVKMRLNPGLASEGQMEETVNNTPGVLDIPPFAPDGTVESFFDVYFELDMLGQPFYGQVPMRLVSTISHKPPGPLDIYESLQQIQLYDGQGNATEYYVGSTRYWPNPVVEIDEFDYSVGEMELQVPDGTTHMVGLTGPSTMAVYFEGWTEGTADDDDANGLDEVQTEMVELDLTGLSPALGPVNMRLNPSMPPSMGEMEETVNNTPGVLDIPPFAPDGTVDSFFDIYFELEVIGQLLHTQVPMRLVSTIGHKPPGPLDIYESLQDVQLYDQNGDLTEVYITTMQYRPNPVVEVDEFEYSIGEVQLQMQDGTTLMMDLRGPSAMAVCFEGTTEGTADDDDGDTRDEVKTEMVDLNLTGISPTFGLVNMHLDTAKPSLGQMEETDNNTPGVLDVPPFAPDGTVDSFFDIYFELELGAQSYYSVNPMRWSGEIGHKPPGPVDVYYGVSPIELYDSMGTATGILVLATRYRPNPVVEVDEFDHSLGEMELQVPDGTTYVIDLNGPSTMVVYFEGAAEGSAYDDEGDLLDEVKTQMVELNLTGVSPVLGTVHMRLDAGQPSLGQMEERTDVTTGVLDIRPFAPEGTVDSFFDVFFEIEACGQTHYSIYPMRWSGVLGHKPPGPVDVYEGVQPIELVDAGGTAMGYWLNATRYQPNPCIRCSDFDGGGVTDMPDLRELAEDWLWVESVGDTYNAADLNCDWTITLSDFAIFAENWLQSCP